MGLGIDGLLLAAGESRRMGYPKALLSIGEETFVTHLAEAMLAAVPRLVVVVGAYAERVKAAIAPDPRIATVFNAEFVKGQLSSLKCGLAATRPAARAVIVHLTDHPLVKPETFARVAQAFSSRAMPIIIARHGGKRGHPVLFARELFDELMAAPLEEGARVVVNHDPRRVEYVDVDDPGVLADLDTPADLAQVGLALPPNDKS